MSGNSELCKEKDILDLFEERGYEMLEYISRSKNITYICACGEKKSKRLRDIKTRMCRSCKTNLSIADMKAQDAIDKKTGEIWKSIEGGAISSFGRARNNLGQILKLCPERFRYKIGTKQKPASRLVAKLFKIEGYEKLTDDEDSEYVVYHLDGDPTNNRIDNLEVISRAEMCSLSSKAREKQPKKKTEKKLIRSESQDSVTSNSSVEEILTNKNERKREWNSDRFANLEHRTIPDFPGVVIYENGEILDGNQFSSFLIKNGFFRVKIDGQEYPVDRLVCYAFNPDDDKKTLEDYDTLRVDHLNENPFDNNFKNLKWTKRHEFKSGSSKITVQLDRRLNYINQFASMIEASRRTGEKLHRIKDSLNGNIPKKGDYIWVQGNENGYEIKTSGKTLFVNYPDM